MVLQLKHEKLLVCNANGAEFGQNVKKLNKN